VDWLPQNLRGLDEAEYSINLDGGEFEKDKDKRLAGGTASERKKFTSIQLESLNAGGHSSIPSPDNAIYHLQWLSENCRIFPSP